MSSDTSAGIAAIASVAGAVVALIAAFFAWRMWARDRVRERSELLRHLATVRPNPDIEVNGEDQRDQFLLAVTWRNSGGACAPAVAVINFGHAIWVAACDLPAHAGAMDDCGSPLAMAETFESGYRVQILVARDVEGRWWEKWSGDQVTEDIESWLHKRIKRVKSDSRLPEVVIPLPLRKPPG